MGSDRPTEADDLYALEPGAFVAARNELARRLRSEGRRNDAATVAGLRRPTPTAWALNFLAREHSELVARALGAGHRLRDATEAAVGGQADELREAIADDQAASGAVVEAAGKQLGARGPGLTPTIRATVRAAVLSDDLADELRRGVLTTEHEAGGFAFGDGFTVAERPETRRSTRARPTAKARGKRPASTSERSSPDEVAARRKARDEERAAQRERRAALEAKVRALSDEVAELEHRADEQATVARTARDAADAAARALDAARRELDEAQKPSR